MISFPVIRILRWSTDPWVPLSRCDPRVPPPLSAVSALQDALACLRRGMRVCKERRPGPCTLTVDPILTNAHRTRPCFLHVPTLRFCQTIYCFCSTVVSDGGPQSGMNSEETRATTKPSMPFLFQNPQLFQTYLMRRQKILHCISKTSL